MTRFDSALDVPEINTPTDTPSSGRKRLYVKTNGVYMQDSAGSETLVGGTIMSNVPVGTVLAYGGTVAPAGFLFSDGSAVSRATYSDLFAVIGTTYGAGDGSTTFNLPNFTGRHPMGRNPGGGYASSLGVIGGESQHYLTIAEMPSHSHWQNVLANGSAGSGQRIDYAGDRAFAGTFPQGVKTDAEGGGGPHNVLDPYTTVNFIIRATPSAVVDSSSYRFFKGIVPPATARTFTAGQNMDFTATMDLDGTWDATNKRWICPQPGKYRIKFQGKGDNGATDKTIRIFKNGTLVSWSPDTMSNAYLGVYHEYVADLQAGDILEFKSLFTWTTCGTDGAGVENTFITIESVGLAGVPSATADTGWITPTLQNGWTQYSGWEPVGYRKKNGIVYLRGLLAPGTATTGTVITTLPAGFRKGGIGSHTPVTSGSASANPRVNIYDDGRVVCNYACDTWLSLANISYIAEG